MNGLVAPYGHYSERMFAVDGGLISASFQPVCYRLSELEALTRGGAARST